MSIDFGNVIGIDNGNGVVKCVTGSGKHLAFPAQVAKLNGRNPLGNEAYTYKDHTGRYWIGDDAIAYGNPDVRSPDSSYFRTPEYRVQALYALEKLGIDRPYVATGLPVEFFGRDRQELVETITNWEKKGLSVQSVRVIPQPLGTLMDVMFDWQGTARLDVKNQRVPVIDIGEGTLDTIEVVNMRPRPNSSAGKTIGVHVIHRAIYEHIVTKYKVAGEVHYSAMNQYLRDGYFILDGEKRDLSKPIKRGKEQLLQAVDTMIKEVFGNLRTVQHVVVSGGGANVLREELVKIIPPRQLVIPENPSMANAAGFAKWFMFAGQ